MVEPPSDTLVRMALLSSMLEVMLCTSLLAETVGAKLYSMLNGARLLKNTGAISS